jgi:outer membrane protein OmpA-like peptidoglycan-associated protein
LLWHRQVLQKISEGRAPDHHPFPAYALHNSVQRTISGEPETVRQSHEQEWTESKQAQRDKTWAKSVLFGKDSISLNKISSAIESALMIV